MTQDHGAIRPPHGVRQEIEDRARTLAEIDAADSLTEMAVPRRTGDLPVDLGRADEALDRVEALWEGLDTELRALRSAAGPLPPRHVAADLADLQTRVALAWQARERARGNRDALLREFDRACAPDSAVLPPGPDPDHDRHWR